jgi:hypothetical protein
LCPLCVQSGYSLKLAGTLIHWRASHFGLRTFDVTRDDGRAAADATATAIAIAIGTVEHPKC